MLCHELAHIRRHDWLVQLAAEMVRVALWFNPLAWMACSRLRRESEQACDDEVLGIGVGAGAYAGHLLDLVRQCRRPAAVWGAGDADGSPVNVGEEDCCHAELATRSQAAVAARVSR